MPVAPDRCAHEVLEVVPLIMRAIRTEMRSQRTPDLSVPQFRALAFLDRQPGASLSEVYAVKPATQMSELLITSPALE